MAKLYSPELSSSDITGYKNSFKLAIEEESAREGLFLIQKMFDNGVLAPDDEEERVAKIILDEPSQTKEIDKEKDEEAQAQQPEKTQKENEEDPEELEYLKKIELKAKQLAKMNREEFKVVDLLLNKTAIALRDKLSAIENCIDICSMVVTDNPGSIVRS